MKRTVLFCSIVVGLLGCSGGGQGHPGSGGMTGSGGSASGGTTGSGGGNGNGTGGSASGGSNGSGGSNPDAGEPPVTCVPPADKDHPVEKLADTGCMDPKNPTAFAPGVYPYEVNSPLWSDGADKDRGFFLPKGGKVHVRDCAKDKCQVGPQDNGHFDFPIGTVMVKNFRFDGKLVETRLFVRFDETTWVGYGYKWNEAQTEATIVGTDGDEVMFDTGKRKVDWHYPSRLDCMTCHFSTAGFTLGPEIKQLNRMVGGENQIDTIAKRGAFDQAPAKPYEAALPTPYAGSWGEATAGASVEARARSYLAANCGYCHRPDGNFPSIDIRWNVDLIDTYTCNVDQQRPLVGVSGGELLVPGQPDKSAIYLRMKSLVRDNKIRMPQIGTFVVDEDALKLIGDWITGIKACP